MVNWMDSRVKKCGENFDGVSRSRLEESDRMELTSSETVGGRRREEEERENGSRGSI